MDFIPGRNTASRYCTAYRAPGFFGKGPISATRALASSRGGRHPGSATVKSHTFPSDSTTVEPGFAAACASARAEGVEVPEYQSARERADRLIRDNPAPKFRGSLCERQAADDLAVSVSRKHCGGQPRREQQKRRAKTRRA
jgi:hypothetical protein